VVVTAFTTIPASGQSQRQWPATEYVFKDALVIKPNTSETPKGFATKKTGAPKSSHGLTAPAFGNQGYFPN
jgi:hypothetical protein